MVIRVVCVLPVIILKKKNTFRAFTTSASGQTSKLIKKSRNAKFTKPVKFQIQKLQPF